eukprot:CAMPEP_0171934894 /NCGR_PEP_ID=MMETSP0993-20121228/32417_1 /TAXON_ID=483369 /ORGANISM="non described non described, Strain CCMP2098" /LENGTH=368 /DNA_ID=CAMNT_0012575705 /DNA_START=21 /DNA_END=1127 /DNA_ORIENTATION=+
MNSTVPPRQFMGCEKLEVRPSIIKAPRIQRFNVSSVPFGESVPLNYPSQRTYPHGRSMCSSNIVSREDGSSLTAREPLPLPVPFVKTPHPHRPTPSRTPDYLSSNIPGLVFPQGGPYDSTNDAGGSEKKTKTQRSPASLRGTGRFALGCESDVDALEKAEHLARRVAEFRATTSQFVFGARNRPRKQPERPGQHYLNYESDTSRIASAVELARQCAGASAVLGRSSSLNVNSAIDFNWDKKTETGSIVDSCGVTKGRRAYPGGKTLNYESSLPLPPRKTHLKAPSHDQDSSYNNSRKFSALVFGDGNHAKSTLTPRKCNERRPRGACSYKFNLSNIVFAPLIQAAAKAAAASKPPHKRFLNYSTIQLA